MSVDTIETDKWKCDRCGKKEETPAVHPKALPERWLHLKFSQNITFEVLWKEFLEKLKPGTTWPEHICDECVEVLRDLVKDFWNG